MAGIVAYGAYVPLFRLGRTTAGWEGPNERAAANYDEDSLTMAVAALRDALTRLDPATIDALYFATTTQPYAEKQSATTIGWATDLRSDLFTVDCTDSLRAGTNALKLALDAVKADSARRAAVVAADHRLAQPRSAFERTFGDGAAALVLGDDRVIASIDGQVLQVTPERGRLMAPRGVKAYLAAKKVLPTYEHYLKWRGFHQPDPGVRRPPLPTPSATALFRERERNLRFCAAKCRSCGTVQYPPQRVCTRCRQRDDSEQVRLADKPARLFTYALDYIAGSVDVPLVVCIVNFEGGGRALMTMTDRVIEEIEVDMPLEMSFRKLYEAEGVHNYYWKCTPVRVRN
jgi:uncharacterized OB-fold protein